MKQNTKGGVSFIWQFVTTIPHSPITGVCGRVPSGVERQNRSSRGKGRRNLPAVGDILLYNKFFFPDGGSCFEYTRGVQKVLQLGMIM